MKMNNESITPPQKLLYDSHETAAMLSISLRSLERLKSEGKLRCVKVGRRSIRFCRDDIDKFIEQNKTQTN